MADWLSARNFLYLSIRGLILNNHQNRRNISRRDGLSPNLEPTHDAARLAASTLGHIYRAPIRH